MKNKLLALAFSLIMVLSISVKSIAQTTDTTLNNPARMEKLLKDNNIPCLGLGVIRNGKIERATVYGELKKGFPAPQNTVFGVASITKTITTMVTLQLVNSGKWNLDEPVFHYWTDPDVKDDLRSKILTTRHILTHQTGFANWRWLNASKKLEFGFDPGTQYKYSGEGLEYLRHALENKFHEPLEQMADSLIFKPLGMKDSRLIWKDADSARFAVPHNSKGEPVAINKNIHANAADLFETTVADYERFLIWVMKGAGLSKSLFNEMVSPQVKTKENSYMGLGWQVYTLNDDVYGLSHGGSDSGVRTIAFCFPQTGDALVIFTNSDNGNNTYFPLIKHFLKDKGQQILDIETKK